MCLRRDFNPELRGTRAAMIYAGVAISGKAGAGKDTFARHVMDELADRGIWSHRIGFADAVKEDVERIYGLTKADPGGREALVEYSNVARAENPLVWIERLDERLESLSPYGLVPLIADLRYANEKVWAQGRNMLTVRVDATGMDRAVVLTQRGECVELAYTDHVAETELDEAEFAVRFWNPHGSLSVLPHYAKLVVDLLDGTVEYIAA